MKKMGLLMSGAVIAAACTRPARLATQENGGSATSVRDEVAQRVATAEALVHHGRHLEASYYYEAALAGGGAERSVLPRLIAAQIRSGRLRAARQSVMRLKEIRGDSHSLSALARLLDSLAPGDGADASGTFTMRHAPHPGGHVESEAAP